MGFHNLWIAWIKGCLESATVSVLVNGRPTEEFKPTGGLRQGDPLAPFLFLVVAEGLARIVRSASKTTLLTGLKFGRKEIEVCILQFADDTIFLCEDSFNNVVTLKAIIKGFELASGLKINFHKSKLAGINVQISYVSCYTKTLNCKQMGVPFTYMGLEVGGNPRKKQFWEPVVNKLKAKLSPLTQSVRGLPLSKGDSCRVGEKKASQFAEDVCKPKEEGGLGLREIRKLNHAILAKWRWRCISQEEGRWKELLDSKYGLEPGSVHTLVKLQSWWWKDLYKEQTVGEVGLWINSDWRWRLRWRRARFEWESSLEADLFTLLSGALMRRNDVDVQVWGKEEPGLFSVNSAYECLAKQSRGTQSDVLNLLWKTKAFPNVIVTA
ncbi:uncharacterized protein [Phaseolus vulgaris]|uniref:uncharacterized protein n=1 Tax=Phaseolus vulgaris TaxID=3885 RepID=UPI0035CAE139